MSNQSLNFSVWLRDRTQAGFSQVTSRMRSLQRLGRQTGEAFKSIGIGAAGAWAVGQTVKALVGPAREMNSARAELNSLLDGDGTKTLDIVQATATKFASTYGKSATEFVRASYDIQSAIAGLSGDTLAQFTNASAVLAMATKADTATITSYMGTMYGIFQSSADKMGKGQWVEQIAGQTAVAVKMFKTTGTAMNEAFAGLGARASNQNISSAEQFAILGMIQSSLNGSVSGSAYASFMDAMPTAQVKLGMSFAGDDGKALGMVDIVNKLKQKLGGDLTVDVVGQLNSSFGTVASGLIQGLWNKTDELTKNIHSLNGITNMDQATAMATKIADPWNMLSETIANVRVIFGQALDRALMPMITYMTGAVVTLQDWMIAFPNITMAVAVFAKWMLYVTAIIAAGALFRGVFMFAKLGWAIAKCIFPLVRLWKILQGIVLIMRLVAVASFLAFGWIPVVIAVIALAIGLVIYYWDELVAAFLDTSWGQVIMQAIGAVGSFFADIGSGIASMWGGLFAYLGDAWGWLTRLLTDISWTEILMGALDAFVGRLKGAWELMKGLWSSAADFMGWSDKPVIEMNNAPYVNPNFGNIKPAQDMWFKPESMLHSTELSASITQQTQLINNAIPITTARNGDDTRSSAPQWMQQQNQTQNNHANSMSIGTVNVSTKHAPTPTDMQNYFSLVTP
ncbi:phage tail tape measure protein [Shewanella baltica]|uniref:phage tail tape measure protein n=1 Tax=Shewanella baltica TaxID=62322 RepID=UPI003D060656